MYISHKMGQVIKEVCMKCMKGLNTCVSLTIAKYFTKIYRKEKATKLITMHFLAAAFSYVIHSLHQCVGGVCTNLAVHWPDAV